MKPETFFVAPQNTAHRQYEALRAYFIDNCSAKKAAERFGYTINSFYSLVRDFKKTLSDDNPAEFFFASRKAGRKAVKEADKIARLIVDLRKKYLSVPDIKAALDARGHIVSQRYIYNVIKKDGFGRLPRRGPSIRKQAASAITLEAPKSLMLEFDPEAFGAQNALGILCLLPYIQLYGIDALIEKSGYPETESIGRLSSILSFAAIKLSNVKRYTADDAWCMDRGLGLFAGLNVLPKASWYTSYSSRITRKMNRSFLKKLQRIWVEQGFLSDTANLDFTTIPYWGDASHLENNWSGTRNKGLASMLSVLAQDPESGIVTYGDTTVRHDNKNAVAVEFLDFYKIDGASDVKYLVFDSKFTTYENLSKLSEDVKFLTIRRRGKKIVNELDSRPASAWKRVRIPMSDGKGRWLRVIDEKIFLKDYGDEIRQIAITGHGKIKPALIITNDFDKPCAEIVRKYSRRWLVEKGISEQIEFFHLNRLSSSMVIKVDFDLTMSIFAHNLLRIFSMDLAGFSHVSDLTIFNKFLSMNGSVAIMPDRIVVKLKKKRNLPSLLTAMEPFQKMPIAFLGNRYLLFEGDTTS